MTVEFHCPPCVQLFGESVPSVPLSSSTPQLHQPYVQPQQQQQHQHQQQHSTVNLSAAPPQALDGGYWQENTLDESVWQTLKRDVLTIGRNLRSVLIPVNWDFHNHTAALHNWDLWGPLVSDSKRVVVVVRVDGGYVVNPTGVQRMRAHAPEGGQVHCGGVCGTHCSALRHHGSCLHAYLPTSTLQQCYRCHVGGLAWPCQSWTYPVSLLCCVLLPCCRSSC